MDRVVGQGWCTWRARTQRLFLPWPWRHRLATTWFLLLAVPLAARCTRPSFPRSKHLLGPSQWVSLARDEETCMAPCGSSWSPGSAWGSEGLR